ncbi:MAG TPA: 16S rRNA (cytidine(1402)-2'-O)-methyltransferase [Thermoanaerobaculia bacterium]
MGSMDRDGKLLVIGTPIGNLDDLTPRAATALKSCDAVLAEDTRHSRKLLNHLGINVPLESYHEHNEAEKSVEVVDRIAAGETIGLISDAGTPLLSDPGYKLIRRAREAGLRIEPIPGPFAGIVALVASGLAPTPFAFHGFAPHRQGDRLEFYRRVALGRMTAIVYESPQRVVASLQDARTILGDVEITLAREMTKLHEEFLHGTVFEVVSTLEARDAIRGEMTLVFSAAPEREIEAPSHDALSEEFARLQHEGLRRNDAVRVLAEKYKMRKNELYKILS